MDVDLTTLFENALRRFGQVEGQAIRSGVSERCLCGRLAMILERMAHDAGLVEYRADVEYNRNDAEDEKIIFREDIHRFLRITVDLVLHSRGMCKPDNLIAVEMKRHSHREKAKESDRQRLRAMTAPHKAIFDHRKGSEINHVSGYQRGFLVELQKPDGLSIEEYRDGERWREWVLPLDKIQHSV